MIAQPALPSCRLNSWHVGTRFMQFKRQREKRSRAATPSTHPIQVLLSLRLRLRAAPGLLLCLAQLSPAPARGGEKHHPRCPSPCRSHTHNTHTRATLRHMSPCPAAAPGQALRGTRWAPTPPCCCHSLWHLLPLRGAALLPLPLPQLSHTLLGARLQHEKKRKEKEKLCGQ